MRNLLLLIRFLMELAALWALAYGGLHLSANFATRLALALALSLSAVVLWGVFVAPKSPRRLNDPGRLLIELLVFGGGTAALALSGKGSWAIAFAVLAVIAMIDDRLTR